MIKTIRKISIIGTLTSVNLILSALIIKLLAVILGPTGVGFFSILRQIQQTLTTIGTFNGEVALVHGLNHYPVIERKSYYVAVAHIFAVSSILVVVGYYISRHWFIDYFSADINSSDLTSFDYLVYPILLSCINVFILGSLNGLHATTKISISQIAGSLFGVLAVWPIAHYGGINSLYLLLTTIAAANLVFSLRYLIKYDLFQHLYSELLKLCDFNYYKHFFSFSIATLIATSSGFFTILVVRLTIVNQFDIEYAGFFDAAWTLSSVYLMVFLSSFGTYFLPNLSGCTSETDFDAKFNELFHLSILVSVAVILPCLSIIPVLIDIFYTSEFAPANRLLNWFLLGDYFKVTAWVLSLPLIARAYLRAYLLLSLLWNIMFLSFTLLSVLAYRNFDLIGPIYIITQFVYVITAFLYWVKIRKFIFSASLLWLWLFGMLLIFITTLISLRNENFQYIFFIFTVLVATSFVFIGLGNDLRRNIYLLVSKYRKI